MTIKEIAEMAGVSIATVSKIVNGKDQNMSPETRNKVLKLVREYNYTPYSKIRNTSTSKTFLLGVLLCNATDNNDLIHGIISEAESRGYGVILFDSKNDPDQELRHITALVRYNIDGIIWEPVEKESLRNEHHFFDHNIPVLPISTSAQSEFLHIDYTKIGYALTQSLVDRGHTRIAHLMHPDHTLSSKIKDGFMKCLFDNQITYTNNMQLNTRDLDYIQELLIQGFSGIVSPDFATSLELYKSIKTAGCSIPDDISLVSVKRNKIIKELQFPEISGIFVPFEEFGRYICVNLINTCEKTESGLPAQLFSPEYCLDHKKSIECPSSLREQKLVVIGSINIDCTFNVDCLPQLGKTTRILNSTTSLGGKGANQAVGASRLGHEVSLIGKIGNDPDSVFISHTLENENVSFSGISHDKNEQTGKAFIYLESNGESTISILAGANGNLNAEDIRKQQHLFQNAGYTLLSTEVTLPAIMEAAKISRKYNAKNILKPATLTCLPEELLQHIDILIPNKKEAAALCPGTHTPEEQADIFLAHGVEIVIITLGHEGCYLKTREVSRYFPAADFSPVDTTGGADAFISALASYLISGYPLEKSIEIATYAAGFCISKHGVVPSLADKYSLEQYIARHDSDLLKK